MKKKIPFLSLITILLSSATAIAAGATVFSLVNASFIINEESYFTITDSGHTYKCYTIQDHTVEVDNVEYPTVAIGWVLSDDNTIPTNLSVPETVSYNDTTYFVSAVAKAGFRYCSFTTINLPDTIEEIREEAFAYCEKMTSFAIPYQVTEIAPSTFLDCRSLVNVTYMELDGDNNVVPSLGNKTITSIGDHAFDSCVSMTSFNFPDRLTFFGKSCFQNCSSLGTLDFPAATKNQSHQITNPLTIQSYAFADCSSLTYCYFEENLVAGSVSERAFTDCNSDLVFDFTGTSAQVSTFDSNNQDWRKKYITTSSSVDIPINPGADKKVKDNRYPGLSWVYKSGNIILDSRRATPLIDPLDSTGERYAEITGFIAPTQNVPNYYTTDGALIIPNELPDPDSGENATVKVKVIAYKAFDQNTSLTSVKFNKDLVSINHQAFWHCTGLLNLDFSLCEKLKEIGYSCFFGNSEDSDNTAYHSKVTSLQLPNCLEYIGDLAFANFFYCESLSFKTDNTKPSHLKVLGQYAFNRLGFKKTAGTINLVLPNTLNDQDAEKAKFMHPYPGSNKGGSSDVAIGRHCFDRAFALLTLEMEKATDEQLWADSNHSVVRKDYTCSVGTSAFNRTKYLIRFTASENLWTLGSACFNSNKIGDNNYVMPLREIFLTTKKAAAKANDAPSGYDYRYPWGIDNERKKFKEPLFVGANGRYDLVVYIDGDLPGELANPTSEPWNSERGVAYKNELNDSGSRASIPAYTNVDWQSTGGILYWKPGVNDSTQFATPPQNVSEYDAGLVSIVKKKKANPADDEHYIAARYFCSNANVQNKVDLSRIPTTAYSGTYGTFAANDISNYLKTIGDEAFAHSTAANKGLYIILPYCVENINERSFFRITASDNGVRIVTYRQTNNSGKIYKDDGAATFNTDNDFDDYCAGGNTSTYPYYCCLPSTVKFIGKNAFYNNLFKKIKITISSSAASGSNGFYIGNSAFQTYSSYTNVSSFILTDSRTNADFETVSNGLYYIGTANKKTLIYQSGNNGDNLTIANGTAAVGMHAVTQTRYKKITVPSSVTTLYGGAFQKNNNLEEIIGADGLEYISATEPGQTLYTAIWSSGMPFDITDYWNWVDKKDEHQAARAYAFKGCAKLKTINFKAMTSLKKVGRGAFDGCKVMEEMTGGTDTYSYRTYSNGSLGSTTSVTKGVLDLSLCSSLRSISAEAFINCNAIKYVHLPDSTNGNRRTASTLYIGINPDTHTPATNGFVNKPGTDLNGKAFNQTATKILVGETVHQARKDISNNKYQDTGLSPTSHYYWNTGANAAASDNFGGTENVYFRIDYPIVVNNSFPNTNGDYTIYRDLHDTNTAIKYWIKIGDDFILFENYGNALNFCQNVNTLYPNNTNYVNG